MADTTRRFTAADMAEAFNLGVHAAHEDAVACRRAKRKRGMYVYRKGEAWLVSGTQQARFASIYPEIAEVAATPADTSNG